MIPGVSSRRLYKLTDICIVNLTWNVLPIARQWKAKTTPPCNTHYEVMHYANHKVNSHNYGVAWKLAVAAMPLLKTWNVISEVKQ